MASGLRLKAEVITMAYRVLHDPPSLSLSQLKPPTFPPSAPSALSTVASRQTLKHGQHASPTGPLHLLLFGSRALFP